jgi:hypothetical protein
MEEIRKARRESSVSPLRREELRANVAAVQAMLAGTGEGIDEFLAKFPFRSQQDGPVRPPEAWYSEPRNPAMLEAVRKMLAHQARTGHRVTDQFRK